MINESALNRIKASLQRIFSMKITRSTFREVQNAIINATGDNKDLVNDVFESFLSGKVKDGLAKGKALDLLNSIMDTYSIPVRLSKEVHERGEFVNIITSDTLTQADRIAFLNRIRRIDGEEFHFVTDPESTIHLLNHFLGRLQELDKSDQTKEILASHHEDLVKFKERLETAMK
ncbi:Protein CT_584 [Chlamydiales bacterium SCGC AG-110-M15]|nr:Protein CT_584 [Chlamydiales bacterium SCGC AG-110-M15]